MDHTHPVDKSHLISLHTLCSFHVKVYALVWRTIHLSYHSITCGSLFYFSVSLVFVWSRLYRMWLWHHLHGTCDTPNSACVFLAVTWALAPAPRCAHSASLPLSPPPVDAPSRECWAVPCIHAARHARIPPPQQPISAAITSQRPPILPAPTPSPTPTAAARSQQPPTRWHDLQPGRRRPGGRPGTSRHARALSGCE